MVTLCCLFLGITSTLYVLSTADFFTPAYTNHYNLVLSGLGHLGLVLGPAAVCGTKYLDFCLYNKAKFGKVFSQSSYATNTLPSTLRTYSFLKVVPLLLLLTQMNLNDEMRFWQALPGLLWMGLAGTSCFYS